MFKKIDLYTLKTFLPLLVMTSLICWFIVLMQFLWRYMDELVGKGLSLTVVAEIVFYASMYLVRQALPLGILLASLITFGNMGERLELLSMKASGVSLYRIMSPLLIAVFGVGLWLYHFQNNFMITSEVRMWTLLYSARYSAPELEVPEGSFYNGITGYSMFVKHRDRETGRLEDVMLYDYKSGVDRTRIIRADSARMAMDDSKLYLSLKLYQGQSFENLEDPPGTQDNAPIPHAIERFDLKEILIPFNANFNRQDENEFRNLSVGKNMQQLNRAIDTAQRRIDSLRLTASVSLSDISIAQRYSNPYPQSLLDTTQWAQHARKSIQSLRSTRPAIGLDSLMRRYRLQDSISIYARASSAMMTMKYEAESRLYGDNEAFRDYRTNSQDWHRKFTYPVACVVFFLIGAPLGAIIRRGGLGVPVVASFLFFIIYYIIDTLGQNLVRSESLSVQLGMWLSTYVLAPIGLFLCYMAAKESAGLSADAYLNLWQRLTGTRVELRQVEPRCQETSLTAQELRDECLALRTEAEDLLASKLMNRSLLHIFLHASEYVRAMKPIDERLESLVDELRASRHPLVLAKTNDLPLMPKKISALPLPSSPAQGKLWLLALPLALPLLLALRVGRVRIDRNLRALSAALSEIVPIFDSNIQMNQTLQ